jgi:hypothetical protein
MNNYWPSTVNLGRFTLLQAMKALRDSRDIALLFLDLGTRRG